MRVVAGAAKGHPLKVPKGNAVRPTTDRVREALFSILGSGVEGARVLDLFAGSGALGIEALSRGATHATFVEMSPPAVAVIHANLATTRLAPAADVRTQAVDRALAALASAGLRFDLVFLDPPYDRGQLGPTLRALDASGILAPRSTVVAEHPAHERTAELPLGRLVHATTRTWGDVGVSFFDATTGACE
jgi:16S rRNA (guanine(966)-N(2))-methyltransferase RsmD